jgi:hypothetical protein
MSKQTYNININADFIEIKKHGHQISIVKLATKTIDLKTLYNNMQVQIDDELVLENSVKKYSPPKNDSERIYNNIYDFLKSLIDGLNSKLEELRNRDDGSVFK